MEKTIKRILVPLDPSIYAEAATRTACQIARVHGGSVGGVVVLDANEIKSSIVPAIGPYYPMMVDVIASRTEHAQKILEDCMTRFASICEAEGVEHFETEWDGIPTQKLLESSISYDLVVVGLRTFFHFETQGEDGECLSDILDETITPVLAVPAKGVESSRKALIAFDGSMASAAALHDFARLDAPFRTEVTVLVAEKEKRESKFLLDEASMYLAAHGIENVTTVIEDSPINTILKGDYLDEFDLIVAGIHSRRRFRDYFVGSFTKSLIRKGTIPVLLSH